MSDSAKRAAGEAAAALVQEGMVVGLGSGTTMLHAIAAIGRRVQAGLTIVGVPTSIAVEHLARDYGIPLAVPTAAGIDLAIDGADEIEEDTLRLIKGRGGALLREKIVAQLSRRFVIVADTGKLVAGLGAHLPLPVEIAEFGHDATQHRIAELGGAPELRQGTDGQPYRTDGGNFILDCPGFAPIRDPFTLQRRLRAIAGVLESGLFLQPVEQAFLGADDGSVQVVRPR